MTSSISSIEASQQDAQQPSAHMCFGCGVANVAGLQIRFFNAGPGACQAEVTLDDRFQGYPGIAHGGIVATMLDEAVGRAPMADNPNRFMYTARLELRYRQPVPLGQKLTVRGRIEKDRGRLVTAVGEVYLPDGSIAAEANATLIPIPPEVLDKIDISAVGWKVYP